MSIGLGPAEMAQVGLVMQQAVGTQGGKDENKSGWGEDDEKGERCDDAKCRLCPRQHWVRCLATWSAWEKLARADSLVGDAEEDREVSKQTAPGVYTPKKLGFREPRRGP